MAILNCQTLAWPDEHIQMRSVTHFVARLNIWHLNCSWNKVMTEKSFWRTLNDANYLFRSRFQRWPVGHWRIYLWIDTGRGTLQGPKRNCQSKPFFLESVSLTVAIILTFFKGIRRVRFPKPTTAECQKIVTELCTTNPVYRLGYSKQSFKEIRSHPWYTRFDWKKFRSRELKAPWVPTLEHESDTRYFKIKSRK